MARSKAKKKRLHETRNGKTDVELHRGGVDFSIHERKLPTLEGRKRKQWNKQNKSQLTKNYREGGYKVS